MSAALNSFNILSKLLFSYYTKCVEENIWTEEGRGNGGMEETV